MKLEDQVCSLGLAKKLKELGVKQDSLFYWADGSIISSVDMDLWLDNGKVRTTLGINNSWPDEDVFMYPQLNLFLVMSDEWKILDA